MLRRPVRTVGQFSCFDVPTCEYQVFKDAHIIPLFTVVNDGETFQKLMSYGTLGLVDLDSYRDLYLWDKAGVPVLVILGPDGRVKLASNSLT